MSETYNFPVGRAITGGVGAFILLFGVGNSFKEVGPGEVGVVTNLGQVTGAEFDSGFHFKWP